MSFKYHINPSTGEPSRCKALFKCRFTHPDNHFPSAEEARKSYERMSRGQLFSAFSKITDGGGFYEPEELLRLKALFLEKTTDKLDYDGVSLEDGRSTAFAELYRSLPHEYKVALDIYANEEQSVIMNKLLLHDKETFRKVKENGLWDNYKKAVIYLDHFLKKTSRPQHEPLYKGVKVSSLLEKAMLISRLETLSPGDSLSFDTYFSTSVSFDAALNFTDREITVIYEIVNAEGSYINQPVEEVLLPRGSKFRFISFEENHDMIDYLIIRLAQEKS